MKTEMSLPGLRSALDSAEQEHGIRIIHVAECDSRAWGFSTEDSDYDLRFIYVKLPWERKLLDTADTRRIKTKIKGCPIDAQGFELNHAMRKISQSMLGMHETIRSPLCLGTHENFRVLLDAAISKYENKRGLINYCRGLMRKNFEFVQPMTAKNLLHALRFALMAERMQNGGELVMHLPTLLEESGFAGQVQEILALREDRHFRVPDEVDRYLYRMCHMHEWPSEEKRRHQDAAYFNDMDMIYSHITRHICFNHDSWTASGSLVWNDAEGN